MPIRKVKPPAPLMENILVYPFIKRFQKPDKKLDPSSVDKESIDQFAFHYMKQLVHHIENHGFPMNEAFYKDFDLVHEAFKSALMRACGKYHPLQGYIDEVFALGKQKNIGTKPTDS